MLEPMGKKNRAHVSREGGGQKRRVVSAFVHFLCTFFLLQLGNIFSTGKNFLEYSSSRFFQICLLFPLLYIIAHPFAYMILVCFRWI